MTDTHDQDDAAFEAALMEAFKPLDQMFAHFERRLAAVEGRVAALNRSEPDNRFPAAGRT